MKNIIDILYDPISFRAKKLLYQKFLPLIVSDRLQIIRRARYIIKFSILLSIVFLIVSVLLRSPRFMNMSGLLLDFAGISRIFISDEWDDIIGNYTDENKYPFGPPSYITREIFIDDDPEIFASKDGEYKSMPTSQHLYYNRGIILIAAGFLFQFLSSLFG